MSFSRKGLVVAVSSVLLAGCGGNISDSTVILATTVRASLDSAEAEGNGASLFEAASISADGRYVAFASDATDLVAGDTNGKTDIFLRDLLLGTTEIVSRATGGAGDLGDGASRNPSISSDGRMIAFESDAINLVPGDGNLLTDIFIRDRNQDLTTLVSIIPAGGSGNGRSTEPSLSADGGSVAFQSDATDLVTGDTNSATDIFVRTGSTTTLASRESGEFSTLGDGPSTYPSISGDGLWASFQTNATNLGSDGDPTSDIYVRELVTPFDTILVSRSSGPFGNKGNNASTNAVLSLDGRFIAFQSAATNLDPGDTTGSSDIFVRDRLLKNTGIVSIHTSGAQGSGECEFPAISGDGRYVAFETSGTSLVNGDTNNSQDIFLRDRTASVTSRVSVATFGTEANNDSQRPALSGDGRYVVFWSIADNLAGDDTNGVGDIFRRGPIQ